MGGVKFYTNLKTQIILNSKGINLRFNNFVRILRIIIYSEMFYVKFEYMQPCSKNLRGNPLVLLLNEEIHQDFQIS